MRASSSMAAGASWAISSSMSPEKRALLLAGTRRAARKLARLVSCRSRARGARRADPVRCRSIPTSAPARPGGWRYTRARPARMSCTRTRAKLSDDRAHRERRAHRASSHCSGVEIRACDPGRRVVAWERNCVAIGEAACVFDPSMAWTCRPCRSASCTCCPCFRSSRLRGRARRIQQEPAGRRSSASATFSPRTTCSTAIGGAVLGTRAARRPSPRPPAQDRRVPRARRCRPLRRRDVHDRRLAGAADRSRRAARDLRSGRRSHVAGAR